MTSLSGFFFFSAGEHPGRLRTIPLSSILVRAHVHEYVHMYVNVIEISGENLDTDLSNQSRSSIQVLGANIYK